MAVTGFMWLLRGSVWLLRALCGCNVRVNFCEIECGTWLCRGCYGVYVAVTGLRGCLPVPSRSFSRKSHCVAHDGTALREGVTVAFNMNVTFDHGLRLLKIGLVKFTI